MRSYLVAALTALGLLAVPAATRAADARPAEPTVVVRLEPLDDLLADARYLGTLADREELVKQLEGMVKSRAGARGLDGIDLKRPLGFYGTVGAQGLDSSGVLLVPVADEKAFLGLLENVNLKPEKGKDGVYTIQHENALAPPVFFRFANGYAYATVLNEAVIDRAALLPPERVLAAGPGGALAATVFIDRIPDNIRQLALGQIGLRLADVRDRYYRGETSAETEFFKQTFEELGNDLKAVLRDGRRLALRVNVDRKAQELTVEATVDGKAGSKLATRLADLGQARSLFAGLLGKDAALQGLVRLTVPEDVRRALKPVLDENLKHGLEKEENPERRERVERFVKALQPTLDSGDVDAAVVLRPPAAAGGAHSMVVAVRLKDGEGVDRAFHEVVQGLPETDRDHFKLDAEQVGGVKVHRLDVQKEMHEKAREAFGDNPVYLAFRPDAVFFVLGANGLETMRQALAAQPAAAAPVQLQVSLARLAPAIAINRGDSKGTVTAAAQKAFGPDADAGLVRITVEGGQALSLRFRMKAPVLKFVSELDKAEQAEK